MGSVYLFFAFFIRHRWSRIQFPSLVSAWEVASSAATQSPAAAPAAPTTSIEGWSALDAGLSVCVSICGGTGPVERLPCNKSSAASVHHRASNSIVQRFPARQAEQRMCCFTLTGPAGAAGRNISRLCGVAIHPDIHDGTIPLAARAKNNSLEWHLRKYGEPS